MHIPFQEQMIGVIYFGFLQTAAKGKTILVLDEISWISQGSYVSWKQNNLGSLF